MSDGLDNLVACVHLLRTEGGVRLVHPNGSTLLLPTPIAKPDLATLFLALAEGWLIEHHENPEPMPQDLKPPTTAVLRRFTTSRRRRSLK